MRRWVALADRAVLNLDGSIIPPPGEAGHRLGSLLVYRGKPVFVDGERCVIARVSRDGARVKVKPV